MSPAHKSKDPGGCSVGKVLTAQESEFSPKNPHEKLGMVTHTCNPSTREAETALLGDRETSHLSLL